MCGCVCVCVWVGGGGWGWGGGGVGVLVVAGGGRRASGQAGGLRLLLFYFHAVHCGRAAFQLGCCSVLAGLSARLAAGMVLLPHQAHYLPTYEQPLPRHPCGKWLFCSELALLPPLVPWQVNRAALRSYFIANILTFFLALSTAVFCASENMPHAMPPTAGRAVFSLVASTVLLFMTLASGASTFLSGALAVYPSSKYGELIPAAAVAGAILVLTFWWYSLHVWRLFFRWRALRRAAPLPHLEVTGSSRNVGVEKALKAILLK